MLVKVLQRIARSGSMVIMSVHQPSHRILGLLDRMILLSRGETAYSGSPSNLHLFFADFGRPIPDGENRTEFALDLVRELEGSPGGTKGLVEFNKSWQKTLHRQTSTNNNSLSLKEAIAASISRGKLVSRSTVQTFANPLWFEVVVLSKRMIINSTRMPEFFIVRTGSVLVTGLILASVFWKLDSSPKGVEERYGFFAFAMTTTFYTQLDALPAFILERYIFMRETAHNAYRRSSYVLSHTLTSLPTLLFLSVVFAAITFWSIGLGGSFLFYLMITMASFWAGNSLVTLVSAAVPQIMVGYVASIALISYFLLFSGFLVNRDRIPSYWIWFHYGSLIKYPYEAVLINEFHDDRTRCFLSGTHIFDGTPLVGTVSDGMKDRLLESMSSTLGMTITSTTCVTTGPDVLQKLGINGLLSKWDCLWVTIAWGVLYRILFYLVLLLSSKNKRR